VNRGLTPSGALTAAALAPLLMWNWDMLLQWKLLPMPDGVAATLGLMLLALISRFWDKAE
jgi:hypothetical protein